MPKPVQRQINGLLTVAIELPPDNPLRGQIRDALNKMAKDNNLPINFDDYLGTDKCPAPKIKLADDINPLDLRWRPEDIPVALKRMNLCQGVTGDDYEKCEEANYGKAVMWAEPMIGFLCRRQTVNSSADEKDAKMDECAQRKFDDAWGLRKGKINSVATGSMVEDADSCKPPGADDRRRLRDYLRARLAAANGGDDDTPDTGPPPPDPPTPPPAATDVPSDQVANLPSDKPDDEAFCNFIADKLRRGELIAGGGTPIPPECRREIALAKEAAFCDGFIDKVRRVAIQPSDVPAECQWALTHQGPAVDVPGSSIDETVRAWGPDDKQSP